MTPEDIDLFSRIVKGRSGLVLTPEKAYLLESRLLPVARKNNLEGLEGLAAAVRTNSTENLLEDITDAMTTNETFFCRDTGPFDRFREHVLPPLIKNRAHTKSLRIWCAAAATGQEPYSLAMILMEMASQLAGWKLEIVATDISKNALSRAQAGLYTQFEVQRGLPIQLLMKYFTQEGSEWRVNESVREMIEYKPYNLLDNLSPLGSFDVVFCRNVLIYFERDDKAQILNRIRNQIQADGSLFLGGAETVVGITDKFITVPDMRGIFAPA